MKKRFLVTLLALVLVTLFMVSCVQKGPAAPVAPVAGDVEIGIGIVTLNWGEVPGATSYTVSINVVAGTGAGIAEFPVEKTVVDNFYTWIVPFTGTFSWKVKANNAAGSSEWAEGTPFEGVKPVTPQTEVVGVLENISVINTNEIRDVGGYATIDGKEYFFSNRNLMNWMDARIVQLRGMDVKVMLDANGEIYRLIQVWLPAGVWGYNFDAFVGEPGAKTDSERNSSSSLTYAPEKLMVTGGGRVAASEERATELTIIDGSVAFTSDFDYHSYWTIENFVFNNRVEINNACGEFINNEFKGSVEVKEDAHSAKFSKNRVAATLTTKAKSVEYSDNTFEGEVKVEGKETAFEENTFSDTGYASISADSVTFTGDTFESTGAPIAIGSTGEDSKFTGVTFESTVTFDTGLEGVHAEGCSFGVLIINADDAVFLNNVQYGAKTTVNGNNVEMTQEEAIDYESGPATEVCFEVSGYNFTMTNGDVAASSDRASAIYGTFNGELLINEPATYTTIENGQFMATVTINASDATFLGGIFKKNDDFDFVGINPASKGDRCVFGDETTPPDRTRGTIFEPNMEFPSGMEYLRVFDGDFEGNMKAFASGTDPYNADMAADFIRGNIDGYVYAATLTYFNQVDFIVPFVGVHAGSGMYNNHLKIKACTFAGNLDVYGNGILFNGANIFNGNFTVSATGVKVTGEAHFHGMVTLDGTDTIIGSGPYFHNDLNARQPIELEDVKFAAEPNRQTVRLGKAATLTNIYFDEGVAQTVVQAEGTLTLAGNIVGNPDLYESNSSRNIMHEWHKTTKIISGLTGGSTPIIYQDEVNVSDVVIETTMADSATAPFQNSSGGETSEAVFENVYFADNTDGSTRQIIGNENSFIGVVFAVEDGNTQDLEIQGAENYFEDVLFMPKVEVGTGNNGTETTVASSTFQATVTVNTPANALPEIYAPTFVDTTFLNDLVVTKGEDAIYQRCSFANAMTLDASSVSASFLDNIFKGTVDVTALVSFGDDEGAGNTFNDTLTATCNNLVFYNSVFAINPEPEAAPAAPNKVVMGDEGKIYFHNVDILHEALTAPQWVFDPGKGTIRLNGQINNLRDDNFEMGNTAANFVEASYKTTEFAVGDATDPEGNTWPTHVNELNSTNPLP